MKKIVIALCLIVIVVGGCGDKKTKTTSTSPPQSQEVNGNQIAAQAKKWPSLWCQVKVGMTRGQAINIMGPPTNAYSVEEAAKGGFDPQTEWTAAQFHFTAFYNLDDKVRQLDGNETELSKSDKEQIKCSFSRR